MFRGASSRDLQSCIPPGTEMDCVDFDDTTAGDCFSCCWYQVDDFNVTYSNLDGVTDTSNVEKLCHAVFAGPDRTCFCGPPDAVTAGPSDVPSVMPSSVPSTMPSSVPSDVPTSTSTTSAPTSSTTTMTPTVGLTEAPTFGGSPLAGRQQNCLLVDEPVGKDAQDQCLAAECCSLRCTCSGLIGQESTCVCSEAPPSEGRVDTPTEAPLFTPTDTPVFTPTEAPFTSSPTFTAAGRVDTPTEAPFTSSPTTFAPTTTAPVSQGRADQCLGASAPVGKNGSGNCVANDCCSFGCTCYGVVGSSSSECFCD